MATNQFPALELGLNIKYILRGQTTSIIVAPVNI